MPRKCGGHAPHRDASGPFAGAGPWGAVAGGRVRRLAGLGAGHDAGRAGPAGGGGVRVAGRRSGALAGLLAVLFQYGVLQAVGPGRGQLRAGGYGVARRVPVLALEELAVGAGILPVAQGLLRQSL